MKHKHNIKTIYPIMWAALFVSCITITAFFSRAKSATTYENESNGIITEGTTSYSTQKASSSEEFGDSDQGIILGDASLTDETEDLYKNVCQNVENGCFNYENYSDDEQSQIIEMFADDPEALNGLTQLSESNNTELTAQLSATYIHASKFSGYDVINGIDISKWNGTINWSKVKAANYDFVFIRAAYRGSDGGNLVADSSFATNMAGAIAAGLDVGVYIYSQAITVAEGKEEADYAINLAKNYTFTLPVVMDYEYSGTGTGRLFNAGLSKSTATSICNAFCQESEAKGYTAALYANKSMLTAQLNADTISVNYPVWLAHYTTSTSYTGTYDYWQYSDSGSVDGISGITDLDFRYMKKPAKVTGVSAVVTSNGSRSLSWKKVPGVYAYQVCKYDTATKSYKSLALLRGASTLSYTDSSSVSDSSTKYKVRAYYSLKDGNVIGDYSDEVIVNTSATVNASSNKVTNLTVERASATSLKLTWTPVKNVDGYRIQRYDAVSGKYSPVEYIHEYSTSTWTDTSLAAATTYSYKMEAFTFTSSGSPIYYACSDIKSATTDLGAITGFKVSSYNTTSNTLTWNKQTGATGYLLYHYVYNKGWVLLAKLSNSQNTYTESGLTAGKACAYNVRSYVTSDGKNYFYGWAGIVYARTAPKAATNVKVSAYTDTKVNITWSVPSDSGIQGFKLYRYDTKKSAWVLCTTLGSSSRSYTFTNLDPGSICTLSVLSYSTYMNGYFYGTNSKVYQPTTPAKISGLTTQNIGTNQLIRWDAQDGVTGYYVFIYDKTAKKCSHLKTNVGDTNNIFVTSGTSSNYAFYVRSYITYNGTTYPGILSSAATLSTAAITATINGTGVNVRSGAGTSTSVVTAVSNQSVTITGSAYDSNKALWYGVSFTVSGKSYKGYVRNDYIKFK